MNKVLKSRIQKVTASYFDSSTLSFIEKTFKAEEIAIGMIHNCVTIESRKNMPGYKELQLSLVTEGMKDPIIVINNDTNNWNRAIQGVKSEYINNESRRYKNCLALTGNSRLACAEEYKYDYIDCIVVPNFVFMHSVQLKLQNGVIKHELY